MIVIIAVHANRFVDKLIRVGLFCSNIVIYLLYYIRVNYSIF